MTTTRCVIHAALAVCMLAFAGCGPATDKGKVSEDDASGRITLRIMSFNIEWGGTHVRFDSVADAIRKAKADVVGIQEPEGNLARLAKDLGWYYNPRNYVVSRFPLIDPPDGEGRFLFVEVAPNQVVALANVHLPSSPSGTSWLRNGRSAAEVEAMEREVRLPAIEPVLDLLAPLEESGMPVFLTGDFNAPSYTDWSEAAIGKLPNRNIAFEWPVSRAVADAGLRDSFRVTHPDPVAQPGFTWWAGRPKIEDYNPSDPDTRSRIDFVWYAEPTEVSESLVVGEANADGVDIAVSPWPSDHRAVMSVFRTEPAPLPEVITTSQRVYDAGDNVEFTYLSATSEAPAILLERVTDPGAITPRIRLDAPAASGTFNLPGGQLSSGHYKASLLDDAGFTVSSNEFWILSEHDTPSLKISGKQFATGAKLPFEWSGAPGNRYDWVGIFPADAAPDSEAYVTYGYVDARSSGSLQLGPENVEDQWPVPPGRYVARLLLDDGFKVLAETPAFTVTEQQNEDSHQNPSK